MLIDALSRYVELEPSPDVTAKSDAKAIFKHIGRYGMPSEIQSDQDTQFSNQIVDDLLVMFQISRRFTLPYRPETNGMERVNQETMKHLKAITYEGGVKRNWSQYLPLV